MSDVVIIGGGIIGCAAAEALTRRGARVQLVDPRGIGEGATQASGGMLLPHMEGQHDAWLAAFGARSLGLYEPMLARLGADAESAGFVRRGSLQLALDDREAGELRTWADDLRARGVPGALLSGEEARAIESEITPRCVAALDVPEHAFIRAADLSRALWRESARRGARMVEGAAVRIEKDSHGGLTVRLHNEQLRAPAVVFAAGSWAGHVEIAGVPPLPVRPVRGQLLRLAWQGRPLSRILAGTRCYTLTWPDGTMLAGATVEDVGFDDRATAEGVRQLLDGVVELVPRAAEAAFTSVRVGFRPATPDSRPIIGRSDRLPGLVYATGHYRNGVLLAPVTGELVAKAVAGEDDPAFEVTTPRRFGDY